MSKKFPITSKRSLEETLLLLRKGSSIAERYGTCFFCGDPIYQIEGPPIGIPIPGGGLRLVCKKGHGLIEIFTVGGYR